MYLDLQNITITYNVSGLFQCALGCLEQVLDLFLALRCSLLHLVVSLAHVIRPSHSLLLHLLKMLMHRPARVTNGTGGPLKGLLGGMDALVA